MSQENVELVRWGHEARNRRDFDQPLEIFDQEIEWTFAGGRQFPGAATVRREGRLRRLTTETKQVFKTTEFWGMVGGIAAILVSAAVIKAGDSSGTDEFLPGPGLERDLGRACPWITRRSGSGRCS